MPPRNELVVPEQSGIGEPAAGDLLSVTYTRAEAPDPANSGTMQASWDLRARFEYVDVDGNPILVNGRGSYVLKAFGVPAPRLHATVVAMIRGASKL